MTEHKLKSLPWDYLQNVSESIKSFGAYSLCNAVTYLDEGIPFLRGQNIKNGFVDFQDCYHIDNVGNELLWKSEVKPKMVLLTMSGSVGEAATALETWNYPVNSNQDIAKITTIEALNPFYLTTFLNCKYGNLQMKRLPVGSVQQHTFIWQLEKLIIPKLSDSFQTQIENLVKQAHARLEESKALYAEAENLLLAELGLRDWNEKGRSPRVSKGGNSGDEKESALAHARASAPVNYSIKSFRASFLETGRLDAEYYQPKYDYALAKLKELKPSAIVPLESLLDVITNGQTPLHHDLGVGDVTFLTAEHIFDFRVNYNSEKRVELEHHHGQLAKTEVKKGDVLITIKGKIGNAAVVEDVPRPTNINQDVGLLRLKDGVNPYFVAGFINSVIGKMFTEQISTGQINPFLGLGNLRTIPIPLFDNADEIGEKLKNTVIEAETINQKSKHLLELAKRAVEMAIEQDETAALALIEHKTPMFIG